MEFETLEDMILYSEKHDDVMVTFGADKATLLNKETYEELAVVQDERAGAIAWELLQQRVVKPNVR